MSLNYSFLLENILNEAEQALYRVIQIGIRAPISFLF
jgi:hypothetical protein